MRKILLNKKLGFSIFTSILLISQLSTVFAETVVSSTGKKYEVSETLRKSPGSNEFSFLKVSPHYGSYYKQ